MKAVRWFPKKFIEVFNDFGCTRHVQGTEKNKWPKMNVTADATLTTFYLN